MPAVQAPQMRVGVIGLGGAARQMLPSFQTHPHVVIAAGADPREDARDAFSTEFSAPAFVICPLLSGPKLMIFWTTKETRNAEQEASPGRDYRQAA